MISEQEVQRVTLLKFHQLISKFRLPNTNHQIQSTIQPTAVSFKTLSSTYISKHPYFTARKDSYQTPSGKVVDPYFVVELPPAVMAMAITENKEVILVRQYRYPINETLMEIPGGFMDAAEAPQQAIRRELLEETGYTFSSFHYLGITAANPGVLNNFSHMFLAAGGVKTAEQQLDPNEEITLYLKSLNEVKLMLEHHEIKQSLHALCLLYGFAYLEKNDILDVR